MGVPSQEHTNIKCRVRGPGALSYRARRAVAQSGVVVKLRMGLWNHEVGVWAMSREWGLLSSGHTQTSSCPTRMNFPDDSYSVKDEPQRWVFVLHLSSRDFFPSQSIDKLTVT